MFAKLVRPGYIASYIGLEGGSSLASIPTQDLEPDHSPEL